MKKYMRKLKKYILFLGILLLFSECNENKPTMPYFPDGIPDARALDNVELIRTLERQQRSDTVLIIISGYAELDGTLPQHESAWYYFFAKFAYNIETDYIWDVRGDGKVEFFYSGPPIKGNNIRELAWCLKINSDEAINIALQNGANNYVKEHPNAIVQMEYIWKGSVPTITMRFFDLDDMWAGEPQWWIRSDTGEFLYTDYELCTE